MKPDVDDKEDGPDRGQKAGFDRSTGEVHGSGSGAGRDGSTSEDYDADSKGGGNGAPR